MKLSVVAAIAGLISVISAVTEVHASDRFIVRRPSRAAVLHAVRGPRFFSKGVHVFDAPINKDGINPTLYPRLFLSGQSAIQPNGFGADSLGSYDAGGNWLEWALNAHGRLVPNEGDLHFGKVKHAFGRGPAIILDFKHDARLVSPVDMRLGIDIAAVDQPSARIENIGSQLALGGFSSFAPLNNRRASDNCGNGPDVMLDKVAESGKVVPKPVHESPASALIVLFGLAAVFFWGRR